METIEQNYNRKKALRQFYPSLLTYSVVMLFLVFINYIQSPGYWWVVWPAAGWGLGIAVRFINTFFKTED